MKKKKKKKKVICPNCQGDGMPWSGGCKVCKGTGWVVLR